VSGGRASEAVYSAVGEESGLAMSILGERGWESYAKQKDFIDLTADTDYLAPYGTREREEMEEETTSPYFRSPSAVERSTILHGGRGRPSPGGGRATGELWPEDWCENDSGYGASEQTPTSSAFSSKDPGGNGDWDDSYVPLKPLVPTPGSRFQQIIERARPETPWVSAGVPNPTRVGKPPSDSVLVRKKPTIELTPDQNRVLQLILEGKNVFFTGPAGTGKSLILEHVKYHLATRGKRFAVTAPTGVAAAQLGGSTIHSFSGVGLGDKGLRDYVGMSLTKKTKVGQKKDVWRDTRVLIIDEISMVSNSKLLEGLGTGKTRERCE
jgi:hypothetical protein